MSVWKVVISFIFSLVVTETIASECNLINGTLKLGYGRGPSLVLEQSGSEQIFAVEEACEETTHGSIPDNLLTLVVKNGHVESEFCVYLTGASIKPFIDLPSIKVIKILSFNVQNSSPDTKI
jgi:hypothetical protein